VWVINEITVRDSVIAPIMSTAD